MATNFVQNGDFLEFTAGADVAAGEMVQVGSLFGVATDAVANGAVGVLAMKGVFTLAKENSAGSATTVGGPVYFISGEVSGDDDTGNRPLCGHALEVAADGATTVKVRLLG